MEFVHEEALNWIMKSPRSGVIFVTVGTLDYFARLELDQLREDVRERVDEASLGILEPVNMDLSTEKESQPRGSLAFSHNYPYLFRKHGYHVLQEEIIPIDPSVPFYSNVCLVAVSPGPTAPGET